MAGVQLPRAYDQLRIAQLLCALVVLGLLAYEGWAYDDASLGSLVNVYSGAIGVGLFTACLTILFAIYHRVATVTKPSIYNAGAFLGLEVLAFIFWLISWALLATCVADIIAYINALNYYYDVDDDPSDYGTGIWDAALAFALIEWLLFIATLALYTKGFLRGQRSETVTTRAPRQTDVEKQVNVGAAPGQPATELQTQPAHSQATAQSSETPVIYTAAPTS